MDGLEVPPMKGQNFSYVTCLGDPTEKLDDKETRLRDVGPNLQ